MTDEPNDFERAGNDPPPSLLAEFVHFLKESRKWWMIPIAIVLTLLGVLAALAATGAAPFIYTVF